MEIAFTEKEKKVYRIILAILFICAGLGFTSEGIFTKTVTIVPTETKVNAHLYEKTTWPPFKIIDTLIPNVKRAEMTTHYGRSGASYGVELETYNGNRSIIKVTSYVSNFSQKLQDQINDAIKNKTYFTITFRETSTLIVGILCLVVGFSLLFYEYLKSKKEQEIKALTIDDERKKLLDLLQQRMQQKEQGFDTPHQQNKPKQEKEKYKKINDSIIK
ncbi:MAG: hypothetical protein IKN42_03395 [Elusimicrobia bacterium]|nr:hypothetical protein [Elusimicrobiota bacterium]